MLGLYNVNVSKVRVKQRTEQSGRGNRTPDLPFIRLALSQCTSKDELQASVHITYKKFRTIYLRLKMALWHLIGA